ncbi:threonine dehydrogenase-like Zn-dependent dehydrogenase [Rhodovulum imhoffii]|uniref:Threonine dehydrogenase-like Zn-dependent dehydrogenase n=1 Tax=Rhodovulum imhoffii TaxID=365340 RepID=A0A2T5BNZ4_9RHOB|nr:zinc-binding dehydrogenase [Rhodovulum imhoffii]MBK5933626.1 dehydrogenase [Rhodovulum imhoffii]PTN00709.1 threonine dehydrogenase-like Zn-dependent dehydrogenase [Rhodovulum imhoffii]
MAKEVVISAKSTFVLQDYEDETLGADEIRGPTIATLISQGTEMGWAEGEDFPIRPGYAAVFRVEEIGDAVEGVEIGELRFCMGYHRQTQQHAARFTLKLPDGMAPEVALLARLMGVSMTTLMSTKARPGDKVVICGAGPVGILAAHNFAIGGYDVSVVEPDAMRRAQLRQSGIGTVHARMPLEDTAYLKKVALVVDCSGHESAVLDGCHIVRPMGEVVLVGVPWRKYTDLSAHEIMRAVFFGFVNLRGGWEWEVPIQSRGFVWEELLEGYNNAPHSTFGGFARALRWLSQKRIDMAGLMTSVSPANPAQVYSDIAARKISEPFIIYDWSSP